MEVVDSREALSALAPVWRELEELADPLDPFLSWDWQQSWWEVFGAGVRPQHLVVQEHGVTIGVVPLCEAMSEKGVLVFAGGVTLSDRMGYLHRPGREDEVAKAALEWARSQGVSRLDLHLLPEGSPALLALSQQAAALGWAVEEEAEEVCPGLDLPGDFDSYLALSLGKKDRHELRRKLRRLGVERPGWRLVGTGELGLDRALRDFLRLLAASGGHKAAFLVPEVRRFFEVVAARFEQRGWLRLLVLTAGDDQLAGIFAFTVGRTWYLYNSGYDPRFAALSPGLLCVAEGIRGAISEGCTRADLLRGDEGYKYHLGAHDQRLMRLRMQDPR